MARAIHLIAFALIAGGGAAPLAQDRLPIYDTHLHYSRDAWSAFPPAQIIALLDGAGVTRALVSSTPDDGSLTLVRAAPISFVPILRPYREGANPSNWFNDPGMVEYLEARLKAGTYRGIGEFHLYDAGAVATPTVRRVVALAVERDIVVHVHSGAEPVKALFALDPKLKVLWAHAGMSEPPEIVGPMLDRHAALWTEVSFRAGDIAPGGNLAPAWRDLLLRYSERIMVGTDTYVTARWHDYAGLIEQHRGWLGQLPQEPAEAIAWRNATRLFAPR